MTNKQKEFIDKTSEALNKTIGEAIAKASITTLIANIVDYSLDKESVDYFKNSVLKVLNDYVEITKEM